MAPATAHPMSTYEARKASFFQKETAAGPSRKRTAASTKTSWPHPFSNSNSDRSKGSSSGDENHNNSKDAYPSPRSLASLGLYYSPLQDEIDRCCVYPDGQTVSGWEKGQSALDRLVEQDPTISWVLMEMSKKASEKKIVNEAGRLVWEREEEQLLPTGKVLVDARYRTFGGAWLLDGKKGWKPTSKKLASAGFYFSPNDEEEDCVSCAYCQCSLGGWEKSDDPVKEHQKRKPDCAMFISEVEKVEEKAGTKETASKAASTSMSKTKSVSKKRAAEADEVEDEIRASSSGAKITTSSSRSKKGKVEQSAVEDSKTKEGEAEVEEKPAAKKRKKATAAGRSKARSVKKKTAAIEEQRQEDKQEEVREEEKPEEKEEEMMEKKEEEQIEEKEEKQIQEKPSKTRKKKVVKKAPVKKAKAERRPKLLEQKKASKGVVDVDGVEASDFEEEPSRSHSRDSDKVIITTATEHVGSPPTSCESQMFETPKQVISARTTEKTSKVNSPIVIKQNKTVSQGDIPLLEKLDTLTSRERTMTVEEWLKTHVGLACAEMEAEGNRRIAKLKMEMDGGRAEAERILRGINVN